jgi:hypothetical protein
MKRVSKNLALWIVGGGAILLFVIFYFKSTKESFVGQKGKAGGRALIAPIDKMNECLESKGTWKNSECRCPDRYVNNDSNNTKSKCKECASNTIKVGNECKECPSGQYLDGNSCIKCPDGTNVSATGDSCVKCETYEIIKNNKCTKCPVGTIVNVVKNVCNTCPPGKYVKDNACKKCPAGTITSATRDSCEQCPPGQYVDGNSCKKCPDGTIVSATGDSCEKCPDGSTVSATGTSCDICNTFITNNKCFSCAPGWRYIDRKCYNPGYFNPDGSSKIPINQMIPGVKIQFKPAVRVKPGVR